MAVTCFPFNEESLIMIRSNKIQEILDGESMVTLSWNGSSTNFDLVAGVILDGFGERQLWLDSEDSNKFIAKIRRYSTVEIRFTKLVGRPETRTLTLQGSSNAIDRVYGACRR